MDAHVRLIAVEAQPLTPRSSISAGVRQQNSCRGASAKAYDWELQSSQKHTYVQPMQVMPMASAEVARWFAG